MMLVIENVLNRQELEHMRTLLAQARWHDGRETAGYAAMRQKSNEQLRAQDEVAVRMGQVILHALSGNARFISFALPLKILSPMFNCYRGGGEYGFHIDNAIRVDPLSGQRVRTDVSTTVFLNDPQEYEGGELIINDTYGIERVKLPAGHAVVYPGSSLHRVSPVTSGQRVASFFWTQSMVQDDAQRAILFDLDQTIQQLAQKPDNAQDVTRLTGTYHNLIRQWAQT
ncbi:PKHD-type hydroxylase [Lampropedia hyalina DSM 16112]|jgi:PKHD-type hydroxylase|uniref:PKHD-type hydroxylase n=1 Tax=Lampropedia hyalina DSM 16112 TaxID=1122156 RepID=A0A1M5C120_9BURK|nr:Fe2+-dependent dioxygenase [Lampropedia hyalina]SHF48439.1 PKHD-type hydroxylase [Lampropedia hyalina DSM 16112]